MTNTIFTRAAFAFAVAASMSVATAQAQDVAIPSDTALAEQTTQLTLSVGADLMAQNSFALPELRAVPTAKIAVKTEPKKVPAFRIARAPKVDGYRLSPIVAKIVR